MGGDHLVIINRTKFPSRLGMEWRHGAKATVKTFGVLFEK